MLDDPWIPIGAGRPVCLGCGKPFDEDGWDDDASGDLCDTCCFDAGDPESRPSVGGLA